MTREKCTDITVIAIVIILIVAIAGLQLYAYTTERDALKESIKDELKTAAGIMATQVNATALAALRPGDENTPQYAALVNQLRTMRSMNDQIVNAYIMKVSGDGTITFLVDDLALEDPQGSAKIGQPYAPPGAIRIFEALSLPTTSDDVYTDEWGTFISGYAPVDDSAAGSSGNTVAVLGIDMAASDYHARVNALSQATLVTGIITMLISLGLIAVLVRTMSASGEGKKKE